LGENAPKRVENGQIEKIEFDLKREFPRSAMTKLVFRKILGSFD